MKLLNLPNILTLLRLAVIPVIIVLYYLPTWWGHPVAAFIFMLACITDWLDGYLARSLKLATRFGEFLDPVADKVMVCIVLILVVGEPQFQFISVSHSVYTFPAAALTIPAAIIVSREIIVSALREWMAELGKRTSVAVSWLGKVKTAIQMVALTVLLFCDAATRAPIVLLGYLLLYVAALLTIWSMIIYLKAAWPALNE
ncbi:MAG: CDP-diacylglycerol--glycerol-3-phosphate 3-phosphatidyltransferase [Gammaproteobacteria bacterium]|nr:CDP-diacylglycerol--glycerol-3-phosphate 3-phosphatidyltransferase [Gammaproteobacteria bacterium]